MTTFDEYAASRGLPTLADWRASSPDGAELPAYAWPGGYPVVYYTADGLTICAKCANGGPRRDARGRFRAYLTSDPVVAGDIYWEGPTMPCDDGSECGAMVNGSWAPGMIESAYGDPDSPED